VCLYNTALLMCRMLVGVGEASFCALAAPFIDDFAPPARKALWLAIFYLCIPLGGVVQVANRVGSA
jgi:MFS family permease